MIKYLVIQLDDTSVSYCHYANPRTERKLMPIQTLKNAIFWAMKENLSIQFVYPSYQLPQEYLDVIETIDHSNIVPFGCNVERADVIVAQNWHDLDKIEPKADAALLFRTDRKDLFDNYKQLVSAVGKFQRINIVITDVEKFTDADFNTYKNILSELSDSIAELYGNGRAMQLNLLTDRMLLDKMNNCNAGWESLALAPDGKFYVCPAFYLEADGYSIGDLHNGLDIKNPQLYKLDHAPICRHCDAYQCKRCIWLNRKTTLEVNTPSHEQCVMAHLERNASRDLLAKIRKYGTFLPQSEIKEIDYLDPFDKRNEW